MRPRLTVLIAVVWGGSFVDSLLTANGVTVFGLVTPVMLVVITGLFALNRNGNGKK